MSLSFEVANALIVVPNFKNAVLSSWNEMLSLSSDIKSIQFVLWSLDGSNNLPIVFLPISNFSIRASRKNLILLIVKDGLLECSWFEKTKYSCSALQVPDDARTITACTYCLIVIFGNLDRPNSTSVFLHGSLHHLCLLGYLPNSDFSLCSSWNNSFPIGSGSDCSTSMIMGIVDYI